MFSFKKNLFLAIKYVFSFFLVFKFYKSGLQIKQLNPDHLRFQGSGDIGGFFIIAYFKR